MCMMCGFMSSTTWADDYGLIEDHDLSNPPCSSERYMLKHDFNNDGRLDLAVAYKTSNLHVHVDVFENTKLS